jgi:hypothetical protein
MRRQKDASGTRKNRKMFSHRELTFPIAWAGVEDKDLLRSLARIEGMVRPVLVQSEMESNRFSVSEPYI